MNLLVGVQPAESGLGFEPKDRTGEPVSEQAWMDEARSGRSPRGGGGAAFVSRVAGRPVLVAGILVLITVLAYLPALDAGFVFDDSLYVTEDARMASLEGLGRIWTRIGGRQYQHQYYPLTSSAFWLQHRLWGERPFGYHFVNVLLHAANAVLLWRILRRLRVPGAWLAGAIFAVHPVHVQSVAWVAELKNVLSGLFFLLSMLVFVRYFRLDDDKGDAQLPPDAAPGRLYALGFVLFLGALLSKTATCLLPAALLLVVWWKRGRIHRRDVMALAPLVLVGLSFGLMTTFLESHHGGARGDGFSQPWLERSLIAGRALWFYADKLLRPVGLTFIYPRWECDAGVWWNYLYPLAAAGTVAALWLGRRRLGRGPVAAVAFFVVALAPISFVNVAFTRLSYVADHWQYWASMGPIALAAGACWRAGSRWAHRPPARWGAVAAAAVVVGVLSGLTYHRGQAFQSRETLWRDTLARNPAAWVAHHNLGAALGASGRIEEAMDHYRRALGLNPDYADAHNSLAAALHAQGRLEEAIAGFREALRADPDFAEAHFNLANTLRERGDVEAAIRHYQEAVRINPGHAPVHNNLGVALFSQGRLQEAIFHFQEALRIDPADGAARVNLGLAHAAPADGRSAGGAPREKHRPR